MAQVIIYVDIDDTLVRSFGSKRIPMTPMVEHVRRLHSEGALLYAWSSGGGDYARTSAQELGIADCFLAFLPKPHVMIDDQRPAEWRSTTYVHPGEAPSRTLAEYRSPPRRPTEGTGQRAVAADDFAARAGV